MSKAATRATHSTRCVCHGNGYWFAGRRRIECGYRPCIACGNSRYQPDQAGVPYRCEYCTETLLPTAAGLGVPPVAHGDADLSRIRVLDRESPEGQEELRRRAERKAKHDRIEGTFGMTGMGSL